MNSPQCLALFDCDGTLVDSQFAIIQSMTFAFEKAGLPRPTDEMVRSIVGLPLYDGMARMCPGLEEDIYHQLCQNYSVHWRHLRHTNTLQEPLFSGVASAIYNLAENGWMLGVATGKSYRGLVETLSSHNLHDVFHTLQTADKTCGKPDPEMVYVALDETGCEANNTVLIGDTTYDMEMAGNAGVAAIGVAWGYHSPEHLKSSGAIAVARDIDDLTNILHEWKKSCL